MYPRSAHSSRWWDNIKLLLPALSACDVLAGTFPISVYVVKRTAQWRDNIKPLLSALSACVVLAGTFSVYVVKPTAQWRNNIRPQHFVRSMHYQFPANTTL